MLAQPTANFDQAIFETLEQLAAFLRMGQGGLWLFQNDELQVLKAVRYATGDPPLQVELPFATTSSWAANNLRLAKAVVLTNGSDDLSVEAREECNYLNSHGLKCLMVLPVHLVDQYAGILVFASQTYSHSWGEVELHALCQFACILGVMTQQRYVEHNIRIDQAKWRTAIDEIGIGLWSWDLVKSERSFANDNILRLQGNAHSSNEQALQNYLQIVHPDDLALIKDLAERCIQGETPNFCTEHRISWPDGSLHWVKIIGHLVVDSDNVPIRVVGVMQEVSSDKAVQTQVAQQSEELLFHARMLSQVERLGEIGGWEWDVINSAFYWTPETYRIFGLTPEIYSPNLTTGLNFYVPASALILRNALNRAVELGESFELKLQLVNAHGAMVWVRVNGCADIIDGKTTRIYGSIQDVTLRTQTEEQLREAQKMEAIGQLAGGIAHDFNNLLTTINGMGELALRFLDRAVSSGEIERVRHYIGEIHRASNRAAELTRQLLAFSRKQILHPRVLDLRSHMMKSKDLIQQIVGERIEVVLVEPATLGAVMVDPAQIDHVLANLASNARDAMPNGGQLTIRLANTHIHEATSRPQIGLHPGRYVLVEIEDTGHGMTREVQSRLFDPFFTTKALGAGTGLGLSTVYGIVRQSGGVIEVLSELGVGSTFRIFFPQSAQGVLSSSSYVRGGTETILVVDSDDWSRQRLYDALESKGYRMLVASSGREAITLCESYVGYIHLLVANGEMREMSGPTLVNRTRMLRPNLRILLIFAGSDDETSGLPPSLDDYYFLRTPFSKEMLAGKVRGVLDAPPVRHS